MTKRVRVSAIYFFDIEINDDDYERWDEETLYNQIYDLAYDKLEENMEIYEDFDVEIMDW